MTTMAEITEKFIMEHKSIKACLKDGIINYSALARKIANELDIEKESSKEAILVAARRFKEKNQNKTSDDDILKLFSKCNIELKNNIVTFTLEKMIYPDALIDIEKKIKRRRELFFSIEGTRTVTVIVQKQNKDMIKEEFKNSIVTEKEGLTLINVFSPGIAETIGAVSYISDLFYENEINIDEFMSCHDETLVVIDSRDVSKIITILNFSGN